MLQNKLKLVCLIYVVSIISIILAHIVHIIYVLLGPGSRSSSTSSLNSIGTNDIMTLKSPLRDQQQINNLICTSNSPNNNKTQAAINRKPLSGNLPYKSYYSGHKLLFNS